MTDTTLPDQQLAVIRARQNLNHDPDACGTCRRLVAANQAPEHAECERRPFLIPAPDMLDYEALVELTDEQRQALPARFHIPVFDGGGVPNAWLCAVCWGDGWVTQWPCKPALDNGRTVFAAQHHGERARWDGTRLLAEVDRLRAELAERTQLLVDESSERERAQAERDQARAELEQARAQLATAQRQTENAHCRLHHIQARVEQISSGDDPCGVGLDLIPWLDGPLHPDDLTAYRAARASEES